VSKGFNEFLNTSNKTKYDLVIYDAISGGCLLGLYHKFAIEAPLISLMPLSIAPFTANIIPFRRNYGTATHFALCYGQNMDFLERLHNSFVHFVDFM
jgi:hypothetical protein